MTTSSSIHVVRESVTASELKLVLGRHAHEENIHADSLLYMISSLGIDPHECEAVFEDVATIQAKNEFVTNVARELPRDLDMTELEDQRLLAKNIFVFSQCMEGTQFYWHEKLKETIRIVVRALDNVIDVNLPDRAGEDRQLEASPALSVAPAPEPSAATPESEIGDEGFSPEQIACSIEAARNGEECET